MAGPATRGRRRRADPRRRGATVRRPVSRAAPEHEAELVARARRGDQDAFGRLAEEHRRALQLHCYRMTGSRHDAEDLVQETLLRAWRRLDGFEQRAPFPGWLHRIATNTCLDALARLLHEDAVMSMPPQLEWYAGRDAAIGFLRAIPFGPGGLAPFRLRPTAANRQAAVAIYPRAPDGDFAAMALAV